MRAATVTALSLALGLHGALALAQDSNEEQARAAFQRGVAAVQQRRYEAAIGEFERSYALVPRCSTQFNLAVALEQVRRSAESLEVFSRYQADCAATMPSQNVDYLLDAVPRLRARVGSLLVRASPPGQVAAVVVDQTPRTDWRGDIALDPGAHTVEVRARDGSVVRREVQVTAGSASTVEVTLGAPPRPSTLALAPDPYVAPAPAPAPDRSRAEALRVESPVQGATVYLDGRGLGEAPLAPALGDGSHTLELRADGHRSARVGLGVRDGAVTRITPRMERDDERPSASTPVYARWWFWAIVGVALAGGAAALAVELSRPTDEVVYTFQALQVR